MSWEPPFSVEELKVSLEEFEHRMNAHFILPPLVEVEVFTLDASSPATNDTGWQLQEGARPIAGWAPVYRILSFREPLILEQLEVWTDRLTARYHGQGPPHLVKNVSDASIPDNGDRELAELPNTYIWIAFCDSSD